MVTLYVSYIFSRSLTVMDSLRRYVKLEQYA